MCKFVYSSYTSCKCEFYKEHAEYCKVWLYEYPWYSPDRPDRPAWLKTVIIQRPGEHGVINDNNKGICCRTMPENPEERFKNIGCINSTFKKSEKGPLKGKCPYCKPGGRKDEMDRNRAHRKNVELEKERDRESCCVVQ